MTEAQKILQMIEEVDPADTDKLDEIDARVWCLLRNDEFVKLQPTWCGKIIKGKNREHDFPKKYTRSRDALKGIRPEAQYKLEGGSGNFVFEISYGLENENGYIDEIEFQSEWLPTEELAELHAIIQAIEYERG